MDYDKLIEDLRGLLKQYGEKIPYGELVGAPWPYSKAGDLVWPDPEPYFIEQAATALSTLQAENEKLRETVDKYATAARVIALHLKPFCDESLPYDEMIADAARKASDELEQVKRERDAIEQDFRAFTKQWWEQDSGFPCRWCKFENSGGCERKAKQPNEEKICAGRAFEWRGQKEG